MGKHEEVDNKAHAIANPTLEEVKNTLKEKDKNSLSDSLDDSHHVGKTRTFPLREVKIDT